MVIEFLFGWYVEVSTLIVALISGFLLVALGVAAHGIIAQALVVMGAWLVKNIVFLGFLQTKTGRKTVRAVRGGAYAQLGGTGRRRAYRLFGAVGKGERRLLSWLGVKKRRV